MVGSGAGGSVTGAVVTLGVVVCGLPSVVTVVVVVVGSDEVIVFSVVMSSGAFVKLQEQSRVDIRMSRDKARRQRLFFILYFLSGGSHCKLTLFYIILKVLSTVFRKNYIFFTIFTIGT